MDCLLSLYLYSFCVIFPLHLPFALRHLLFFYNPHFPFFIQVLTFCFIFFRDYWQQIFLFEKWLLIFISHLFIFNSFDIKVYSLRILWYNIAFVSFRKENYYISKWLSIRSASSKTEVSNYKNNLSLRLYIRVARFISNEMIGDSQL